MSIHFVERPIEGPVDLDDVQLPQRSSRSEHSHPPPRIHRGIQLPDARRDRHHPAAFAHDLLPARVTGLATELIRGTAHLSYF